MAIIRAKQGVITRVLPHQGNRRYLIPGGMRGYPLGAGGITPTLDLNFAADKSLVANIGPTLTCTRSGDATYFDASGVMQTAGTNTARFDHDPSDSNASLGLLIEEARTNVQVYSESFDNAAWTKDGLDIDADASIAPDGATTMDRFNVKTTTSRHRIYDLQTAFGADVVGTHSIFVKDDGARWVGLNIFPTTGTYVNAVYDLTTESVTQTAAVGSGAVYTDSGIENIGGGIYRIWLTGSVSQASPYFVFQVFSSATPTVDTAGGESFTGIAGNDVFIFGAQVEAGSFPTSYIPTTTTSVTREKDVVSANPLSGEIVAGPMSWYADFTQPYSGHPLNEYLIHADNGTSTDRLSIWVDSGKDTNVSAATGAGNNAAINPAVDVGDTRSRYCFGWAANDAVAYLDGAQVGTDTDCAELDATPTRLGIGTFITLNANLNGHIARIVYYDERLTDTQLEDLSNGTFP